MVHMSRPKARPNVSAELTEDDKKLLDGIIDDHDMVQYKAFGRILQWFVRQDHSVQTKVLGFGNKNENFDDFMRHRLFGDPIATGSTEGVAREEEVADGLLADALAPDEDRKQDEKEERLEGKASSG